MNTAFDIGFGLVAIVCLFVAFVWGRAAIAVTVPPSTAKYKLVAWGLCVASLGIFISASERVINGPDKFEPVTAPLLAAAGMIIVGKMLVLGSTAIGTNKRTLKIFALVSAIYIGLVFGGLIA